MALSILSNAAANQASFSLNKNSSKLQQSLTATSSGKKINAPADAGEIGSLHEVDFSNR